MKKLFILLLISLLLVIGLKPINHQNDIVGEEYPDILSPMH